MHSTESEETAVNQSHTVKNLRDTASILCSLGTLSLALSVVLIVIANIDLGEHVRLAPAMCYAGAAVSFLSGMFFFLFGNLVYIRSALEKLALR